MKHLISIILLFVAISSSYQYSYLGSNFTLYQSQLYDRSRSTYFDFDLHALTTVLPQNCSGWSTFDCSNGNCNIDKDTNTTTDTLYSSFTGNKGTATIQFQQFKYDIDTNIATNCTNLDQYVVGGEGIFAFAQSSKVLDYFNSQKFSIVLGDYPTDSGFFASQAETDQGFIMFDEYSEFETLFSNPQEFTNVDQNWEMTVDSVVVDGITLAGTTKVRFDPLGSTVFPETLYTKWENHIKSNGYVCGWAGTYYRYWACNATSTAQDIGQVTLNSGSSSITIGGNLDKNTGSPQSLAFGFSLEDNFTNRSTNVTHEYSDTIILGRSSLLNYYMVFDFSTSSSPTITFKNKSSWGTRGQSLWDALSKFIYTCLAIFVCCCGACFYVCCYLPRKRDEKRFNEGRKRDQEALMNNQQGGYQVMQNPPGNTEYSLQTQQGNYMQN